MRRRTRIWSTLLLLVSAGFVLFLGVRWGERIEVRRIQLPISTGDGSLRLAVVSDIHIGANGFGMERWRRTRTLIDQQKPDAILLLGDFVTSHHGTPALTEVLEGIHAPLGVYAVLGNHDHWAGAGEITHALKKHGVEVLTNRAVRLKHGQHELWLVGIDDLWSGKPDWQKAFRGVPSTASVILLSHNPDAVLAPQRERANLILSGHTHGGHIGLPLFHLLSRVFGIALIPHSEYGARHPYGLHHEGTTWIYVTKGVTAGSRLSRWYNAREVVIVETGHLPTYSRRDAR